MKAPQENSVLFAMGGSLSLGRGAGAVELEEAPAGYFWMTDFGGSRKLFKDEYASVRRALRACAGTAPPPPSPPTREAP